jgi:hypothetical protein
MKNIQTRFLKILVVSVFTFFCFYTQAAPLNSKLAQADSLFALKRYTQSLIIYEALLSVQQYSPAMLLKMAYIQEGLANASKSLYYLNLYYLATGDEQTLTKMQELAEKNSIEGYDNGKADQFYFYLNKYSKPASVALAGLALLMLSWIAYKTRLREKSIGAFAMLVLLITLLAVQINFSWTNKSVMISSGNTYLMSGPSAGADVVSIVGEGHRLKLIDKKDVWMKVQWSGKAVYVKQNQVTPITL